MSALQSAVNIVPLPILLSVATGTVIPYLSALVTKRPSAATGVATAVLAVASGFLSEWAASPDHFDYKVGLATALTAWFVGTKWHDKVLKGSELEDILHAALGGDGAFDVSTLPPAVPVTGDEPAVAGQPPSNEHVAEHERA